MNARGSPGSLSKSLQWRHNERNGVSNHRRYDCLLNRLFRRRSKKTSKLRVTGLCEGNPPVTRGFPSQRASNVENVSIWWRQHVQMVGTSYICKRIFKDENIWLSSKEHRLTIDVIFLSINAIGTSKIWDALILTPFVDAYQICALNQRNLYIDQNHTSICPSRLMADSKANPLFLLEHFCN